MKERVLFFLFFLLLLLLIIKGREEEYEKEVFQLYSKIIKKEQKEQKEELIYLSYLQESSIRWLILPNEKILHTKTIKDTLNNNNNYNNNNYDNNNNNNNNYNNNNYNNNYDNYNNNNIPSSSFFTLSSINLFWELLQNEIYLNKNCEMKFKNQWKIDSTNITYHKYLQYLKGLRVIGGDFVVAFGSHGGILYAHGQPLILDDITTLKWESLPSSSSSSSSASSSLNKIQSSQEIDEDIILILQNYLQKHYKSWNSGINIISTEVVIHNSLFAIAQQGETNIAYYVIGRTKVDSMALLFDSFIDIHTKELLQFIDKSSQVSPFKSPLPNQIIIHDYYLKDYNDDHINDDDVNHFDRDRKKQATVVYDSDVTLYPTTNKVWNKLVDTSLEIKYLFHSLSNGQWSSWYQSSVDFNIEYNLSIANAYFDGNWGIHFGNGFITDDVVAHEWTHGYTDTSSSLVYAFQSGAMNEAFSDIFGESIDILNHDTYDDNIFRTNWPLSCQASLKGSYNIQPGIDLGNRWILGENVTWDDGQGPFRDMYKPECYFNPSSTYSPYYACLTSSYDGGGVHINSGVLNRLFAVLVDGGSYSIPSSNGNLIIIEPLGFIKALNLFWRAYLELTSTSQYIDFALALKEQCNLNIDKDLYIPNIFNNTIFISTEKLTSNDCNNVKNALKGSGMINSSKICSNIKYTSTTIATWKKCASSDFEYFYEDYDTQMGSDKSIDRIMLFDTTQPNYVLRSFHQTKFPDLNELKINCIEIGYYLMGKTPVTLQFYINHFDGPPDYEYLELIYSIDIQTIHSMGAFQIQTISINDIIPLKFANSYESLVIIMKIPVMSEGYIFPGGNMNKHLDDIMDEGTYLLQNEKFVTYYNLTKKTNFKSSAYAQWYIRIHGTKSKSNGNNSSNDLSLRNILIIVGSVIVFLIVGLLSIFFYFSNQKKVVTESTN